MWRDVQTYFWPLLGEPSVPRSEGGPRHAMAVLIASSIDFERALKCANPIDHEALLKANKSDSVIDQIGAAVSARNILGLHMEKPELRRYIQHLQSRYKAVVGSASYNRYAKDIPLKLDKKSDLMKAEVSTLSYRLRLAYITTYIRDREVSKIRDYCALALIASFLIILILSLLKENAIYRPDQRIIYTIVDVGIVGLIGFGGAITSIARRAHQIISKGLMADDPVVQTSAIKQGTSSLIIAGLSGPIFAIVLLLIFIFSGVNIPNITPMFSTSLRDNGSGYPDFILFGRSFWLDSGEDAAKLAIWCFISGFAEKFVPDVLDRFEKATSKEAG